MNDRFPVGKEIHSDERFEIAASLVGLVEKLQDYDNYLRGTFNLSVCFINHKLMLQCLEPQCGAIFPMSIRPEDGAEWWRCPMDEGHSIPPER